MRLYVILFAPVVLLTIMSSLVARARRYLFAVGTLAPIVVGAGLLVQFAWYARPTVERAGNTAWLSLEQGEAIAIVLVVMTIAAWAAVFGALAFAAFARRSGPEIFHRLWFCTAAGAFAGILFPVIVISAFVGRAAVERLFWFGLYIPGAAAGAICGALLPAFARRET